MLTPISPRRAAPAPGPVASDLVSLLGECHARIRRFTALASQIATRRDAPTAQIVEACAAVERYFREALPLHVADEEESVEPRLRGRSAEVDRALEVMAREHEQHTSALAALFDALTAVQGAPKDAGPRDALASAAAVLEAELLAHLALEERVVFPAVAALPKEARAAVVDELRRRRHDRPGAAPDASTTIAAETSYAREP